MDILDYLSAKDDEYQQLQNKMYVKIGILRDDVRFLQIALNLTGMRDEMEEEAVELISKYGSIKALAESR